MPHVASRLWGKVPEQSYLPELAATSQELREYADELGAPYCGPAAPFESRDWFDVGDACQSFAFLPLRTAYTFGLLGLGDEDRAALPSRNGHGVPDAPRRARERRDGALPAAGVTPSRSPRSGRDAQDDRRPEIAPHGRSPRPTRRTSRRSPRISPRGRRTRAPRICATRARSPHSPATRMLARARSRASCAASSRRCTAAGCPDAASPGRCRRGARSTASCSIAMPA